jgi:hypothetical protein
MPDRDRIDAETTVVQDMAARVLANGSEPSYANEKLWRAFQATVRALIHGLDNDPQQLIDAIGHETV